LRLIKINQKIILYINQYFSKFHNDILFNWIFSMCQFNSNHPREDGVDSFDNFHQLSKFVLRSSG
jgi:hypothetical protein